MDFATSSKTVSKPKSPEKHSSRSLDEYLALCPAECVVGIEGRWYDLSSFRYRHPGGSTVLNQCHKKDATEIYKSFHGRNVLKGWPAVGSYDRIDTPASIAFRKLHEEFLAQGFFKTSMRWYAAKFFVTFSFLILTLVTLFYVAPSDMTLTKTLVAGLMLGMFWQQCGFLMHDLMHTELTHSRNIDRWLGMFFGSFLLGVSAHWWRDEHFEHHAFTNVVDTTTSYVDPQMQEEVWAQSPKLFYLYRNRGHVFLNWLQTKLILYQRILWVPICVVGGRLAIIVNGVFKERRWYEVLALTLHTIGIGFIMLKCLPTWKLRCIFYGVAAMYEGVLHVQLLLSHYAKPWVDMKDLLTSVGWYRAQVLCNLNIKNPVWLDWFHGGLNFHIEHHLYPLMPRNRFREASIRVKEVCKSVGLPYDECYWLDGVIRTLWHLRDVASLYLPSSPESTKTVQ